MSELAQGLLAQALELPEEDRRWLGAQLLEEDELSDAPHHDPEFMAELIRRSDEVHAHPERLIETDVAFAEIFRFLQDRRSK